MMDELCQYYLAVKGLMFFQFGQKMKRDDEEAFEAADLGVNGELDLDTFVQAREVLEISRNRLVRLKGPFTKSFLGTIYLEGHLY